MNNIDWSELRDLLKLPSTDDDKLQVITRIKLLIDTIEKLKLHYPSMKLPPELR